MSGTRLSFDRLPDNCQAALFALVTAFPGKGKTALLKPLRAMSVQDDKGKLLDASKLPPLLDTLGKLGWLIIERRSSGELFCLPAQQRTLVLQHLLQHNQCNAWLHCLQLDLPTPQPWQAPSQGYALQTLWLALLKPESKLLQASLLRFAQLIPRTQQLELHPVTILQRDAAGQQVFERLAQQARQLLLEDFLALCNAPLMPVGQAYKLGLAHFTTRTLDTTLGLQLLLQAFWRGDWNTLEQLGEHGLDMMQQAIQYLLRGQKEAVVTLIDAWLKEVRKQTKKRKIDLPPTLNALYCLALIGIPEQRQSAKLAQALDSGLRSGYDAAYQGLSCLYERFQGNNLALQGSLHQLPQQLNGLHGLLLALALYWLDEPLAKQEAWKNRLQDYRDELSEQGYAWLAAEFDALRAVQFNQPPLFAELHQSAGLQPLVNLYQRQETWQHALTALSLLKPGKAATSSNTPKTSRLAWFISLGSYMDKVEPREQKLGAKGQWSKGRAVALKRLLEDGEAMDFLCEQDRQAIRMIQMSHAYYGSVHYELPAELALPRLVGHPALYWSDAPDVRIDLVSGQASLQLQARDGQIHLRLQPENIAEQDGLMLHKETPTRLLLYPISRELRQIADIVGAGLSVPQSAKAQLVEAIGAIAPLLPIHSDIPELASHLEQIPADATLYAHLLPLQAGLRLQLLMRPLAEGGWLRPGHGAQNLLGELDGKAVQACRDLTGERQALQRVLDACPGLARADSDGQEWQLDQPQDALQVLSELHALDGQQLQCVWPEGERMRIKAKTGLSQLKLGLKQQGDWFVLQGEIRLDDGKVLQLRQLLELLKASPGRFLKLDERDWLALDDNLRKRLDELAHLADRITDQGARLSPLTAPLLASLAGEVGEFNADARWQAHLDKLESLRSYQPRLPGTLQAQLRDYQLEGFAWLARLARWGVGACLADDMGLGKTVQTLALLLYRAAQGPQLVVAPTSVCLNWQAESRRFAPSLQLRDYQQERRLDDLGPLDLVIVSYGLLQQDSAAFAAQPWTSVVLDEAQAIKNVQTKRSQAAMALRADFRLIATGTPLENHLGELWNLFRFINPGLLGSQDSFAQRFATPIEQGDAGSRRALKTLIQPFILRRLKSQVLDELPARTEITYKVPLSEDEAHQYEALRQEAVDGLGEAGPENGQAMRVLAAITRLRRFCCHPALVMPGSPLQGSKLQAFGEIVEELLENQHRALVFSQFVDHLSIVRAWLDERGIAYQYLDGATPAKERQARVQAFQAGVGEVFLISLKAGGSGLNLTAADYVIHLDPWWNPAVEDQASDRAHRMGQQRPVTIYRLVTEHTIEEQIVALHGRKRDLADSLLQGGELSAKLDAEALLQLLRGA
ncbi:MAG: DEAD/DEAH box helicase [Methylocystis sp.]|uniref:DEAD/DEAH box helicase n=1 Tax=Methylocystis sp. TaxID=1911079 RepID=UPI003DA294AD